MVGGGWHIPGGVDFGPYLVDGQQGEVVASMGGGGFQLKQRSHSSQNHCSSNTCVFSRVITVIRVGCTYFVCSYIAAGTVYMLYKQNGPAQCERREAIEGAKSQVSKSHGKTGGAERESVCVC